MRPESAGQAAEVLDLLARADDLALAAIAAIAHGDDEALSALVEDRGSLIQAAASACEALAASRPPAETGERVAAAVRDSVLRGLEVRRAAIQCRDEIATALSVLDARQQASAEYQPGHIHGTIDVRL